MTVFKYLYCVIETGKAENFGQIGLGAESSEVYAMVFQDIAMVVCDIATANIDPSRKNVLNHEQVVAHVMEKHDVIPCAFGTVAPDESAVLHILKSNRQEIKSCLNRVRGKVELGLTVLWGKDFFQQMREEHEDIKKMSREIAEAPEGINVYDKKVSLGEMVQAQAESKRRYYVKKIFDELSKLAVEAKLNDTMGIHMVFNAAFLVDKKREEEFDHRVESLCRQLGSKIVFKYSGPWPPHNFADINLSGE